MAKIDLSKMSLDELKKLEKDTGKAIKGFEERQRKEALAAAEAAVSKYGYSLAELTGTSRKKPKSAPPKYAHPENPVSHLERARTPTGLVQGSHRKR